MEYTTKKLLSLRKVTRAITDLLRGQLKDHLVTLTPLFRARSVLGEYIQSSTKETVKGAERAFKDLQALYETVASARPFNLAKELNPPLEIVASALEFSVVEYVHVAKMEDDSSKKVAVTSPLRWILSYQGFGPSRLRELMADPNRTPTDLAQFIVHTLVLNVVIAKQPGLSQVLEALHFPVSAVKLAEFGELPITLVSSSLSTIRPPDSVIIESTEISGSDAFEEVVNFDDLAKMRDSLHDRLTALVKAHDPKLLAV